MEKMALDKKNVKGKKRCVLLTKIGACLNDVAVPVDDELLLKSVSKPIIVVPPSAPIHGSIRVPGSKSISNRVLLLAAMGESECRVTGLLHSDDTQVMMNALKLLGAAEFRYEKSENPQDTEPVLVVKGNGGNMTTPPGGKHVYLGNAGTATRFLATLCTLVGVYSPNTSKETQKSGAYWR
jgi:pentafunctional AROM polypeptide